MSHHNSKGMLKILVISVLGLVSVWVVIFKYINRDDAKKMLECYQSQLDSVKLTEDYRIVRKAFEDTMKRWIDSKLDYVWMDKYQNLCLDSAVFFNRDKSRCLLFYIDWKYDTINRKLDNVKIIGAEKVVEGWQFYYKSYPTIGYERKDQVPYTLKQLSNYTRHDLLRGGYLKKGTCTINYDYVDSNMWFNDDKRKKHQEFLESRRK